MAVRIDPLREMDRLVSSALESLSSATAHRVMPMDLYREGESFKVRLDLPGVDPASLDVDVEDKTLTVRAERAGVAGEDIQWLTRERSTGTFARQLTLGRSVDVENIKADFADGVLTLTIPVAEEAKPRKIEVAHSSETHQVDNEAEKSEHGSAEQSEDSADKKIEDGSSEKAEHGTAEQAEHKAEVKADERELVSA